MSLNIIEIRKTIQNYVNQKLNIPFESPSQTVSAPPQESVLVTQEKTQTISQEMFKETSSFFETVKNEVQKLPRKFKVEWTETKVQQVALVTLALYALIGSFVLANGIIPASTLCLIKSAPLFLLSVGGLWTAVHLTDYENPSVLASIQNDAKNKSLKELLQTHKLENIIKFDIISSAKLGTEIETHCLELDLKEAIQFFNKANSLLKNQEKEPLKIPKSWKSKFIEETKLLSLEQIHLEYPIEELKKFKIITDFQYQLLSEASIAFKSISQENASSAELIEKQVYQAQDDFTLYQDKLDKIAQDEIETLKQKTKDTLNELKIKSREGSDQIQNLKQAKKDILHYITAAKTFPWSKFSQENSLLDEEGVSIVNKAQTAINSTLEALSLKQDSYRNKISQLEKDFNVSTSS